MKRISKKRISIVTLLFLVSIFLLVSNPYDNRPKVPQRILNRLKPSLDSFLDSNTKYVHYKYILDSLEQISTVNKIRIMGFGEGVGIFLFGLTKITECDTCNRFALGFQSEEFGYEDKYFIELKGYTLKEDATFFLNKDKYYIEHTIWDKISNVSKSGHHEIKEVPVRYKTRLETFQNPESALLIPLSKKTYTTLKVVLWIILIPLSIVLSWIIFILPLKTLFRITMGDPFNPKNISNLRISGITLIAVKLLPILSSLILPFFLGNRLPNEIYFPAWLYIHDIKGWLIGGLSLLILSNAFNMGYKLQQDQDLTV